MLWADFKKVRRTCYKESLESYTTVQKGESLSAENDQSETNLHFLMRNIKLTQSIFSKNGQEITLFAFDPNIALNVKSKKRSFLQKNVYKNSTFVAKLAPASGKNKKLVGELGYEYGDGRRGFANKRNKIEAHKNSHNMKFLNLTDRFSNFEGLTEAEFWKLLNDLLRYCLVPNRNLQKQIQNFCHKQFPKWDSDNILKVCDWWVQLGKLEVTFLASVLEELLSRDDLEAYHLVQIFYCVCDCKDLPYTVVSKFIPRLENMLSKFDHSELTIICEAFIKSRSRIQSKPLAMRVLKDIHVIASEPDPYSLVIMLRYLSRSYQRDHRSLQEVASVLTPRVPSVSFIAVPHIATAFAKLRCFHHGMYNAIAERTLLAVKDAENNNHPLRLKDIWMILWAFGRLNYYPPNEEEFFDGLIHQLTRNEKNNSRYPMQLVKSLIALCFLDIYPTELINRTFDESFLKYCEECSVPDVFKHLIILDNSVEIERPDYQGNRLPQTIRKQCLQVPHGTSSYTLELRNETRFVVDSISQVIGERNCLRTSPILPHIRTPGDVEISLDGKPLLDLPVEEHRLMHPSHLKDGQQRYALLIQLENNYRFTPRKLLGVHVMKKRQLSRLGYKVAEVPYYEWLPLLQQSEKKRMNYIQSKLRDADKTAEMEKGYLTT